MLPERWMNPRKLPSLSSLATAKEEKKESPAPCPGCRTMGAWPPDCPHSGAGSVPGVSPLPLAELSNSARVGPPDAQKKKPGSPVSRLPGRGVGAGAVQ